MKQNDINQCFENLEKSTSSPTLILNKLGKILIANEAAIELINANFAYMDRLIMDEPSTLKWEKFVNRLSNDIELTENFNIITDDNEYVMLSFHCVYEARTGRIVAQISKLHYGIVHEQYGYKRQRTAPTFNAYNHLPYAVIISDASGIICMLNDQAEMYLKIQKSQLLNKAHQHIFDTFSLQKEQITEYLAKLMGEKHASIHVVDETANRQICYYQISSIFDEYNNIIVTVIQDETEKKELEHEIEHQQALNVVGQMAA
ncbi:PAS domain-containing protein [Lysinibacillus piscis]|uniref:PAS domain-containing protein n=1 Tax=Lysinibacillus piscis TaxID=2518931 RepID=UPI00223253A9|nr:PAS domain-containing protein [Lysinibacillus sp. KH24]